MKVTINNGKGVILSKLVDKDFMTNDEELVRIVAEHYKVDPNFYTLGMKEDFNMCNRGIPTLTGQVAEDFINQADENYRKSNERKLHNDTQSGKDLE